MRIIIFIFFLFRLIVKWSKATWTRLWGVTWSTWHLQPLSVARWCVPPGADARGESPPPAHTSTSTPRSGRLCPTTSRAEGRRTGFFSGERQGRPWAWSPSLNVSATLAGPGRAAPNRCSRSKCLRGGGGSNVLLHNPANCRCLFWIVCNGRAVCVAYVCFMNSWWLTPLPLFTKALSIWQFQLLNVALMESITCYSKLRLFV